MWICERPGRWFSWSEFCTSSRVSTAVLASALERRPDHQAALVALCAGVLDPLRDALGPVVITSGYRTEALNAAIGGSKTSEHMSGRAVDLKLGTGHDVDRIADAAQRLPFRQCITYAPERGGHVHISYSAAAGPPKRQSLHAPASGGYKARAT